LLPALIFLSCSLQARADYVPQTLNQLILRAEKIVYGEISCVDAEAFEIRVSESFGAYEQWVTVRKFEEWNCGIRWVDYEVGQKSLFFLRRLKSEWYPMGGGNEGELPIHGNSIYIHASTLRRIDSAPPFQASDRPADDLGYNNPYNGFYTELCPFWEAVCTLRTCYRSDVGPTGHLVNLQSTCLKGELEPLLQENPVLKRLAVALFTRPFGP
jgi:hypothetical protein